MATPAPNPARFSTYSGAPSLQPSLETTATDTDARSQTTTSMLLPSEKHREIYAASNQSTSTLSSNDPRAADIRLWSGALERMQDSRLEKQRFVMNEVKSDEVAKLALSAKVERALARRMVGQDAVFRVRKKSIDVEKRGVEVEAR